MSREEVGLARRFRRHVAEAGVVGEGDTLVLALSGGLDSVVLAHLFRFAAGGPSARLVTAHVDHGMRPSSAADALWVRGLAKAWGTTHRTQRLDPAPSTEAEARRRRYEVLETIRSEVGAVAVATAHHADDQAETVLFRAARGSGLGGLRGILPRRAPRVWRPLLAFPRRELEAYARAVGLRWREDPTNRDPLPRNILRREILPRLETAVAPGATRALARLARLAREDEAGWASLLPGLLADADLRSEPSGWSVEGAALQGFHPAVRARLLRELARRLDVALGESGTRLAVEFTSSGVSGRWVPLGGGVRLVRDLGRVRVERADEVAPDEPLVIPDPGPGDGRAVVGGRALRVTWSEAPEGSSGEGVVDVGAARFPLTVRGPRPGDRMALEYGTKKLKKLLLEARVPLAERHRTPVLVDADGVVLGVPSLRRARPPADGSRQRICVRITDVEPD